MLPKEQIDAILDDLNILPGVLSSLVIEQRGMIIASKFTTELQKDKIAALASATLSSTKQTFDQLNIGDIDHMLIESSKLKLFISKCKIGYLLIITQTNPNMGLIRTEINSTVKKINNINF